MSEYRTAVTWKSGQELDVACEGKPALAVSSPPEFGGNGERWSPEDLLAGAVESCLLLTTLYFVDQMKIGLASYASEAVAEMKRTSEGLRFQSIRVAIEAGVSSAEDEEKMQKAASQAEAFCPVSAAVNCPVEVSLATRVG